MPDAVLNDLHRLFLEPSQLSCEMCSTFIISLFPVKDAEVPVTGVMCPGTYGCSTAEQGCEPGSFAPMEADPESNMCVRLVRSGGGPRELWKGMGKRNRKKGDQ